MGNALAARLFCSLRRNRVPIWQELMVTGNRISGAVLSPAGKPQRIVARRAVVLATGRFGGSVERLNDYVRPPLAHVVAYLGAAGEGMQIARAVGAFCHIRELRARLQSRSPVCVAGQGVPAELVADLQRPLQIDPVAYKPGLDSGHAQRLGGGINCKPAAVPVQAAPTAVRHTPLHAIEAPTSISSGS
jgi:FAD binding domain